MKPQTAWMLIYEGVPYLSFTTWMRKWCVADAERQLDRPWAQLRKEGFRIVKVRIEEAK